MASWQDWLDLIRVRQWYKNLLVYLALVYSGSLFMPERAALATIAFLALSCASSAAYILNDVADAKRDRSHPEKRRRPIAAGRIETTHAIIASVVILIVALAMGSWANSWVAFTAAGLFALTLIYTLSLRNVPYIELCVIATNYILRAVAGAFAIGVFVSPWLVVGIFALALFLAASKRRADRSLLGKISAKHKPVLAQYSKNGIASFARASTIAFVALYLLFSLFGGHDRLSWTAPFVIYASIRYESLTKSGSTIARNPEKAFTDWQLLLCGLLWLAVTILVLY